MMVGRSRCIPLFAALFLASASWAALAAQEPSQAQEVNQAQEVSRSETPAGGENNGVHTLTSTELEVTRRSIVFPPRPIQPAQVQPGDHVASGISLRNRGGGVINLRGAPANATPVAALLYWDVLDNTAASSMTVSLNGVAVSGAKIGQGPGPCWGTQFNAAYRANVPLYLLYLGINGDYKIAGVPSSKGTGDDPWQSPAPAPLAEGATLVVIYRHAGDPFTKTYIYEAPIAGTMFFSNFATTLGGFSPPAPLNQAKFTLVGADGQIGTGLTATYTVTAEKSFFQGQQIAGPGSTNPWVDNDSDWNGQDVEPLNQLWDTRTHVVPIKPGSTSAAVQYQSQGDCLVTVAFVLSL
jgi:hypothetical protein